VEGERADDADEVDVGGAAPDAGGAGGARIGGNGPDGEAEGVQGDDMAARRAAAGVGGGGAADLIRGADDAQVDVALGDHGEVGRGDGTGGVLRDGSARVQPDRGRARVDGGIEGERSGGTDEVDVAVAALDPGGAGGAGITRHRPDGEAGG